MPQIAMKKLDRNEVVSTLLDIVPQSRMIQVRAPYYKLRFLDGEKEAYSGSANEWYASTYNYRFAEIVLRHKDSKKVYRKKSSVKSPALFCFSNSIFVFFV